MTWPERLWLGGLTLGGLTIMVALAHLLQG